MSFQLAVFHWVKKKMGGGHRTVSLSAILIILREDAWAELQKLSASKRKPFHPKLPAGLRRGPREGVAATRRLPPTDVLA